MRIVQSGDAESSLVDGSIERGGSAWSRDLLSHYNRVILEDVSRWEYRVFDVYLERVWCAEAYKNGQRT